MPWVPWLKSWERNRYCLQFDVDFKMSEPSPPKAFFCDLMPGMRAVFEIEDRDRGLGSVLGCPILHLSGWCFSVGIAASQGSRPGFLFYLVPLHPVSALFSVPWHRWFDVLSDGSVTVNTFTLLKETFTCLFMKINTKSRIVLLNTFKHFFWFKIGNVYLVGSVIEILRLFLKLLIPYLLRNVCSSHDQCLPPCRWARRYFYTGGSLWTSDARVAGVIALKPHSVEFWGAAKWY